MNYVTLWGALDPSMYRSGAETVSSRRAEDFLYAWEQNLRIRKWLAESFKVKHDDIEQDWETIFTVSK
jgi:hypothetical protein